MKGSCLCGEIKYEIKSFAPGIANCHCSMCRKFHGAAYATYGTTDKADLKWISGENFIKTFRSSDTAERGFCSNCGSSIYFKLLQHDSNYEITLGTLDDEPNHPVNANIYCTSKPKWSVDCQTLTNYAQERE